jgi:hypothetical protein
LENNLIKECKWKGEKENEEKRGAGQRRPR